MEMVFLIRIIFGFFEGISVLNEKKKKIIKISTNIPLD
tara:strand:+ start:3393 stop:3506 length:114 start_codon:yes stop_codon:yes gene_type:complete